MILAACNKIINIMLQVKSLRYCVNIQSATACCGYFSSRYGAFEYPSKPLSVRMSHQ